MKLFLLLVISASMLIEVYSGDGYLKKSDGCKASCLVLLSGENERCRKECVSRGASYGYCWGWGIACWCQNLPDNHIWKSETNTCGRKK
uniref:Sodium channel toxin meuNa10 n=1 Tax=Mesobuthus eupeus TaxID=34648 RepID=A0A146CIV1_MESEU|nr:sodium channel toxin meuNa10 [Mesobuthus eupeus]